MRPGELPGAKKAAMPARISPMLATLIEKPFSDPDWLFEIKWDGVRCLAYLDDGKLTLRARSESDITARYPELATLPEMIHARRAILDGEIVALDERGISSFERLQQRMHVRAPSPSRWSRKRRPPTTSSTCSIATATTCAMRRSPHARNCCAACCARTRRCASPIISRKKAANYSTWRGRTTSRASSASAPTASTPARAAPAG